MNFLCLQSLKCGSPPLTIKRCIEVGHTFMLADRYSKCFPIELSGGRIQTAEKSASNVDSSTVLMGCYGIGVTRLMQACVESRQVDGHYPAWPLEIAPYKVCIVTAKRGSKEAEKSAQLMPYLSHMLDTTELFRNEVLVTRWRRSLKAKILAIHQYSLMT